MREKEYFTSYWVKKKMLFLVIQEELKKFLGVDTNALDIEQLPGDISKDEIFMFSENQQQVIFDYLKNQKLINSSRNKNYFYPVVRCSEYKGIYFSDQEIREKRIQFEKGAKTLEDALKLIQIFILSKSL